MPIERKMDGAMLYLMQKDGNMIAEEYAKIKTVDLSDDVACEPELEIPTEPMTLTFSAESNAIMEFLNALLHPMWATNNWRKMHGFPKKRRRRRK